MSAAVLVLIVEDNPDYREVLQNRCELNHLPYVTAGSVTAALELLRSRHFSLVIVDQGLPIRDGQKPLRDAGHALILTIRAEFPSLPILAITAQDGEAGMELLAEALVAGALNFAKKDRDYKGLEGKILAALGRNASVTAPAPDSATAAAGAAGAAGIEEPGHVARLVIDGSRERDRYILRWEGKPASIQPVPFDAACKLAFAAQQGKGVSRRRLGSGGANYEVVSKLITQIAEGTGLAREVIKQVIQRNGEEYRLLLPPEEVRFEEKNLEGTVFAGYLSKKRPGL